MTTWPPASDLKFCFPFGFIAWQSGRRKDLLNTWAIATLPPYTFLSVYPAGSDRSFISIILLFFSVRLLFEFGPFVLFVFE